MKDIELDAPDGSYRQVTAALYDAAIAAIDPDKLETARLLSDGEVAAIITPVHEPGGPCLAYGGTMPDGRVRLCGKARWHGDSHAYEFGITAEDRLTAGW